MNMRRATAEGGYGIRALEFLQAYEQAIKNNKEATAHPAVTDEGEPAVVIRVDGETHCFMVDECRNLVVSMEEGLQRHPNDAAANEVRTLVDALRKVADWAEQEPLGSTRQ